MDLQIANANAGTKSVLSLNQKIEAPLASP
jgi:hypothetical protein